MPDTSQLPLGGDLLLYNSDYQVLICRECEYAVQPAAISGHIKQHHKIYRKDRDDILEIVQQFPLVDPADLQYPDLAPQIPCLTVLRGLYCTAKKCTYLCASLKRMQQHWATSHDRTGRPDVDWKPTLMQTFFRGTCTRYFRVQGDVDQGRTLGQRNARNPRTIAPNRDLDSGTSSDFSIQSSSDLSIRSSSDLSIPSSPQPHPDINLTDMSLFFHYMQCTANKMNRLREPEDFWNATVPQVALQHPFLMHGILACSAIHMALLYPSTNAFAKKKHFELSSAHLNASLPLFRGALERLGARKDPQTTALLLGCTKMVFTQKAATFAYSNSQNRPCEQSSECENWHNAIDYIRFSRSNTAILFAIPGLHAPSMVSRFMPCDTLTDTTSGNPSLEPMMQVLQEILTSQTLSQFDQAPTSCSSCSSSSTSSATRHDILLQIWQNLHAAFTLAYASRSPNRRWEAIIYFAAMMPSEWLDLLEEQDPLAMVLLGYYSVIIGFLDYNWWLAGAGRAIFKEVKCHLGGRCWWLVEWPGIQVEVEWVA